MRISERSNVRGARRPGPPGLAVALALTLALAPASRAAVQSGGLAPAVPAVESADPASATPAHTPASFADIIERVSPAVVSIASKRAAPAAGATSVPVPPGSPMEEFLERFFGKRGLPVPERETRAMGSGVIVDPEGYIVTNHHVVEGATEITVKLASGEAYPATLRGRDDKTDLALLEVDADAPLPHVRFGDSDSVRVGDWVIAVGSPFGLGGSVTAGIVSARGRNIQSGPYDDFLQIDAPINRGNSGGPLFDSRGQLVGINTAIFSPTGGNVGIGFAIPSRQAAPIIAALKQSGRVARGWLGVQVQPVTEEVAASLGIEEAPRGALVASVVADSPAERAGLRAGDVITAYDGHEITELRDLPRLVARTEAERRVDITVWRGGDERTLAVTIGRMPTGERVAGSGAAERGEEAALGLTLETLTPDARERLGLADGREGVVVVGVDRDGPAASKGLRPGDVIRMVGQSPVSSPREVERQVAEALEQDREAVLLLVERDGESRFVPVAIDRA